MADPIDRRIEILQYLIGCLNLDSRESISKEDLYIQYKNCIYLSLEGPHEQRVAKMDALDIPELVRKNT